MKANELLLAQFQRVCDEFTLTTKDLDAEQMNWQMRPDANTIGFLLWHVLRTWDSYYAYIHRVAELYVQDYWSQRFGFDTKGKGVVGKDEEGTGTGFTAEDVATVKPQSVTLIAYRDALWTQMQEYLGAAGLADGAGCAEYVGMGRT